MIQGEEVFINGDGETSRDFCYVQNVVQAALTPDAPQVDGIVEECYPPEAYGDPTIFFGAPGDSEAMQANIRILLESTARFAPISELDRIFTAPYRLHEAGAGSAFDAGYAEVSHG